MTILLDASTRVLVQGISGTMGRFQTEEMLRYGTRVVAGVAPGRGGEMVCNVPVFNTVTQAVSETGAELSILFVSAERARDAIHEAIDAGVRRIVCVAEFMPVHDAIEVKRRVQDTGTYLIGPNSSGLISPGKSKAGFYSEEVCIPGDIGVMSKSGTLSYAALLEMKRSGLGATTVVGVGGDEIRGTTFCDCIELFEADPGTRAILIIGEVGGRDEEDVADWIRQRGSKPVVALISGRSIPPGRSIGHAGAMIVGSKGGYQTKVDALRASGVALAETIEEIPMLLREHHEQ